MGGGLQLALPPLGWLFLGLAWTLLLCSVTDFSFFSVSFFSFFLFPLAPVLLHLLLLLLLLLPDLCWGL